MPRGRPRDKGVETSGIFGESKPSEIYSDQEWTYTCLGCHSEVKFGASKCPKCGEKFDWSKPMVVGAKDYDPERERAFWEAQKKRSRRRRR
jgi:hypothetical protein